MSGVFEEDEAFFKQHIDKVNERKRLNLGIDALYWSKLLNNWQWSYKADEIQVDWWDLGA